jgi:Ran GTPase-activating protein (RanGAP) involved in mRNA processing and transport
MFCEHTFVTDTGSDRTDMRFNCSPKQQRHRAMVDHANNIGREEEELETLLQQFDDATVDLSHITITPRASPRYVTRLCAILERHHDRWTVLDLSRCAAVGQNLLPLIPMLQQQRHLSSSSLRELRLVETGLNDAAAVVLAHSLRIHLRVLDLSHNDIGNDGAVALGQYCCHQVQRLVLHHNDVGDIGAEALALNIRLEWLDLRENQIGTAGGKALIQALLRGSIDPKAVDKESTFRQQQLQNLDLYGNRIVIAQVLPMLEDFLRREERRRRNVVLNLAGNLPDVPGVDGEFLTAEETAHRLGVIRNHLELAFWGRLLP